MKHLLSLLGILLPVMIFSQEYSYKTIEFNLQDEAKKGKVFKNDGKKLHIATYE